MLFHGSLEALCAEVCSVSGVKRVIPVGPRSALPLALRMACGLTGRKGVFASHLGSGIASDAIRRDLQVGGIDLHLLRELPGDMPVSLMVTDPRQPAGHETVTLRPLSRTLYKHRSGYPPSLCRGRMRCS